MAAIKQRAPANLERYLWAVLIQEPFVWAASQWWGDRSVRYAVAYCLFVAPILYCACRIALDCLRTRHYRCRAVAVALIIATVTTKTAAKDIQGDYPVISLTEGFVLVWVASLCGFLLPYLKRRDLIGTLVALWLAQAGYSFGWCLHGHKWDVVNWILPPALGIACFSVLAWRLRATPCEV